MMKRFEILVVLASILMVVQAQEREYQPLLKEGKVWNIVYSQRVYVDEDGDGQVGPEYRYEETNYSIRVCGDTLIDGRVYKKFLTDYKGVVSELNNYWREEKGKAYAVTKGNSKEELMYDFTLSKGEEAVVKDYTVKCDEADEIEVRNRTLRRVKFNRGMWVESVGHPWGLMHPLGKELNDDSTYKLLSCYEDDECIFDENDFVSPSPGIDNVDGVRNTYSNITALYSLLGRKLSEMPSKGVVIRNGKKMVLNGGQRSR